MTKLFNLLTALLFVGFCASAQVQLPVDEVFQKAYEKQTRSTTGAPGAKYWQNHANYTIKVDFNPVSRLLKGKVEIVYTNNSPDALSEIWFKLYPNLYKKDVPRKSKIASSDLGDGVQIEKISANGKSLTDFNIDGTNMTVKVPTLLPGKSIKFYIDYHYTLNKGSHVRTGQVDEGSHFVAYFFPRIAVCGGR